ncbi:glutamate racemase [Patescibacteria group bacterium]|nr:glutamate racemase [Patescibacteria group bacterium]
MIGILDSGLGGLTVVKKVFNALPEYQILYYGDTANGPYGNKSKEIIQKYAFEGVKFLTKHGAKIIIIACNTTSAAALDSLTKEFRIIFFGAINPGVRKAVQITKDKKIGVIGTRMTIHSNVYQNAIKAIDAQISVFAKSAPLLVPLIEESWIKKPEANRIIKNYLYPIKLKQVDSLILGCNYYPVIKKNIQSKIGKKVKLIDPGDEVVNDVKMFLEQNPEIEKSLVKGSAHKFFVSDLTPKYQYLAGYLLGQKIKLIQA